MISTLGKQDKIILYSLKNLKWLSIKAMTKIILTELKAWKIIWILEITMQILKSRYLLGRQNSVEIEWVILVMKTLRNISLMLQFRWKLPIITLCSRLSQYKIKVSFCMMIPASKTRQMKEIKIQNLKISL